MIVRLADMIKDFLRETGRVDDREETVCPKMSTTAPDPVFRQPDFTLKSLVNT